MTPITSDEQALAVLRGVLLSADMHSSDTLDSHEAIEWIATRLAKTGPALVSDAQCDAVAEALDEYGRDEAPYECGLPIGWSEGHTAAMRARIRAALEARG